MTVSRSAQQDEFPFCTKLFRQAKRRKNGCQMLLVGDETLRQLDDNLKELVRQLRVRDPNAAMQPLYDL